MARSPVFAVLDTTTKFIAKRAGADGAVVSLCLPGVATTIAVLPSRGLSVLRTAHPKFQLLRGLLLLCTSLFAFFSLKYMPVGEFTAIVMITPLVITCWPRCRWARRCPGCAGRWWPAVSPAP
jgi:drug/metabolite transporter (DMT)-like permease